MHRPITPVAAAWFLAFAATLALADSPLPPPTRAEFRSQSGRFLAVSDPTTSVTTIYELDPTLGTRRQRWSMLGWFREAALADDGEHLLVVTPHLNLLPVDFDLDGPVLFQVRKGELVKTASVMDVVRRKGNLARTTSHLAWGSFPGIDRAGCFRVETTDGSVFAMHLMTGATHFEPATSKPAVR